MPTPDEQIPTTLNEFKSHPALEWFDSLRAAEPSPQLKGFLSAFSDPKEICDESFSEGVKRFIQLANSNPFDKASSQGRTALYGSTYLGLHYNNDLVNLWNDEHRGGDPLTTQQIALLVSKEWHSTYNDNMRVLIYQGDQPAQALDELVKGPAVIECGMFAQLSVLFGIRYMLGNERFNLSLNTISDGFPRNSSHVH